MASLPRVSNLIREQVAREFDDRGPQACRTEITRDLEANNPEILDMAARCARDVGEFPRIMTGFCMFYRLLTAEARATRSAAGTLVPEAQVALLPRVSPDTRMRIVERIDAIGSQAFTREAIGEMESGNPELLIMSHNFAESQGDYAGVMQGFALLYASLLAEAAQQRSALH